MKDICLALKLKGEGPESLLNLKKFPQLHEFEKYEICKKKVAY
jgi:hypothetical protein